MDTWVVESSLTRGVPRRARLHVTAVRAFRARESVDFDTLTPLVLFEIITRCGKQAYLGRLRRGPIPAYPGE
jgi:hypothetical protein